MNATQIDIPTTLEQLDPLLTRRVRYLLRGRRADQIDDATQEVRLVLWRGLAKYDPVRGPVEPFAQRVIDNAARDQLRKLRSRRADCPLFDGEDLEAPAAGPEPTTDELAAGLSRSEAHLLGLLAETPDRGALAQRLGVPPARVYERVSRLRRALVRKVAAA